MAVPMAAGGVGEGASMEMTVEVGDGRIAFGQSASSAATLDIGQFVDWKI